MFNVPSKEAVQEIGDNDPFVVNGYDPVHSAEEDRYQLIGKMSNEVLVFVSYTMRNETVRIISARKAESREEKIYAEQ